jgi:pimeloyl-ACP methyl ester carboxylesterase
MRKKPIVIPIGVLVAAALAGVAYQTIATMRDTVRFPPPGVLVDLGPRRLHLLCIGAGAPTVLFENSGFGNSASMSAVREELAMRTRVCSYDREGVGWSDPAGWSTSVGALADELGVLQDRAGLPPPFVIVASSVGGAVAEIFARRYPERIAGLVFLDAANSGMLPVFADLLHDAPVRTACVVATAAGATGVVRALDPFHLRSQPGADAQRSAALMYGSMPWSAVCAAMRGLPITRQEFARAAPLPANVPLVVMSADTEAGLIPPGAAALIAPAKLTDAIAQLRATHKALAAQSTRGSWSVVKGSTHLIGESQPDVVVNAVDGMLRTLSRSSSF